MKTPLRIFLYLFLGGALLHSVRVAAEGVQTNQSGDQQAQEEPAEQASATTFEVEWDPYYTNVGLYQSLTGEPIPEVQFDNEAHVYTDLFHRSLSPRFAVLEASVNPLPIAGVMLRKHAPGFYDNMSLNDGFNLVESVTAGFEEPYAFSLFLGNVVNYSMGEGQPADNRGFMGYLVSGGNYHIRNNELISDRWYELEWKVKGDRHAIDEKLSWSFRLGMKLHDHPEITDVGYIALRRSHLGFNAPVLSWLLNAGYEFTYQFDKSDLRPVEYSLFIDKKLPLQKIGIAASLGLGIIHTTNRKYSGGLQDTGGDTVLVIRPSFAL